MHFLWGPGGIASWESTRVTRTLEEKEGTAGDQLDEEEAEEVEVAVMLQVGGGLRRYGAPQARQQNDVPAGTCVVQFGPTVAVDKKTAVKIDACTIVAGRIFRFLC